MKEFGFEITFHPRYNAAHRPNGTYSILFTPHVKDTAAGSYSEDILMQTIPESTFRQLLDCDKEDSPEALAIARNFEEETVIHSMSPAEVLDLAREIRRCAAKCRKLYL